MRIAWIEDDAEIIWPVVKSLEEAGHEIWTTRTVADALRKVEELRSSALIILDMILPPGKDGEDYGEYSGITLLRKLRQEHKVTVPVIVLSVVDRSRVEPEITALGVAAYLRKPILRSELKEAVDAALKKTATRAENQ
jgi:CheY-like chemotaxis protein